MKMIAIVEDEEKYANELLTFIDRYSQEEDVPLTVRVFRSGLELLGDYKPEYDVVFMDIEMPLMSGLETAAYLRKVDANVPLIFVTKMAQFAINGYEVNALDFIVKPVSYYNFVTKLKRALSIHAQNQGSKFSVQSGDMIRRLNVNEIYYIEIVDHVLSYHTTTDTLMVRGSMKEREKALAPYHFVRCNSGFLVNLAKVRQIKGNTVFMENGEELPISRSRHKPLISAFLSFISEK